MCSVMCPSVLLMFTQNVFRSIVNGLRGDDNESFYGDRASFASEYSLRDGPNDGVQLHFKEHGRSGSKGSMSSFVSSKKQGAGNRPETKVRRLPILCRHEGRSDGRRLGCSFRCSSAVRHKLDV